MQAQQNNGGLTLKSYVYGFVLSVILSIEAYALVEKKILSGWVLIFVICTLAVTQLVVQAYFFLHLGHESKPQLKLFTFIFAVFIVSIVVFGSLWIMSSLNYNHDHPTSPSETDTYIIKDEGIKQ